MAFQKKERVAQVDSRPQGNYFQQREKRVQALKSENTPEARKALKRMMDRIYRGSRTNLHNWYAPNGRKVSANV